MSPTQAFVLGFAVCAIIALCGVALAVLTAKGDE